MPRRKDNEIYEYKLKSGKTKYGFKTYVGINKATGKLVEGLACIGKGWGCHGYL